VALMSKVTITRIQTPKLAGVVIVLNKRQMTWLGDYAPVFGEQEEQT